MGKFLPKDVSEEGWTPLVQQREHAILCKPEDHVYFRFGTGHGMFITVSPTPSGRVLNELNFHSGNPILLGKLPENSKIILGRTSDCQIKVMHAIVSRQHLELRMQGDILIVKDLGSTNGTYLLKAIPHFDIDEYLETHPLERGAESTLDSIHEAFGATLDDFLRLYINSKGQQ